MNNKTAFLGTGAALLLAVSSLLAYHWGKQRGMAVSDALPDSMRATATTPQTLADPQQWSLAEGEAATRRHLDTGIRAGDIDPLTGLQVSHYYDPMMPASKFEAPGKSPFMDMMLVPAYADTGQDTDAGTVTISARLQQNTGMRTAEVTAGSLAPVVSATGLLRWNEREQVRMQARAQAFVEKLYVSAAFDRVVKGQALADLYVPEWVAAQEEYLTLTRMQGNDLAALQEAALVRMRQAGMDEQQIAAVTASGQVQRLVTLKAPLDGVVTELAAREGMTVMPGMNLFALNGTGTVWAEAEVPESQVALLQAGARVSARTPSLPGLRFEGRIQSLLPALDPALRTRKARLELDNPAGQLVPGMLMQMDMTAAVQEQVLLAPTAAIIDTGTRTVVMLAEDAGRYRPVAVTIGTEYGGQTAILSGLQAGQRIVVSGQFLLDSEASLRGLELRLDANDDPGDFNADDNADVNINAGARP